MITTRAETARRQTPQNEFMRRGDEPLERMQGGGHKQPNGKQTHSFQGGRPASPLARPRSDRTRRSVCRSALRVRLSIPAPRAPLARQRAGRPLRSAGGESCPARSECIR